jgi:hypothetical protein
VAILELHLARELVGLPQIIAVEEGNELSLCGLDGTVPGSGYAAVFCRM